MTSNVGAREINKGTSFGFNPDSDEHSHSKMKEKILESMKNIFNPEFLNRVDDTIVFHPLNEANMLKIVDLEISEMMKKLEDKKITVVLSKGAKKFLAEKGFDPVMGARPLKRAIQKSVEDPLAEEILRGNFVDGSKIRVVLRGSKLGFVTESEVVKIDDK